MDALPLLDVQVLPSLGGQNLVCKKGEILFSPDGKLTQDLIDGFARSIQKNNSLFQLLLGMAKMITALKGDNSFFLFIYKYRIFHLSTCRSEK